MPQPLFGIHRPEKWIPAFAGLKWVLGHNFARRTPVRKRAGTGACPYGVMPVKTGPFSALRNRSTAPAGRIEPERGHAGTTLFCHSQEKT
jgi:hypothetical protein